MNIGQYVIKCTTLWEDQVIKFQLNTFGYNNDSPDNLKLQCQKMCLKFPQPLSHKDK